MAWVYSGFWRRFAAFVVDFIVMTIAFAVLRGALGVFGIKTGDPRVTLLGVIGGWLYFALLESSAQQATLGKRALGVKVTSSSGERIGFGRASGRYLAKFLSGITFGFGYLMVVFTSRRQGLHDMIADTLVVQRSLTPEQIASADPAPRVGGLVIVCLVVAGVCFNPFSIGILAAIAIPAYQNYTVRYQIADGLNVAQTYKNAVTHALASGQEAETLTSASLHLPVQVSGRYVDTVRVQSGVVSIAFGRFAGMGINGKSLLLIPGKDRAGNIIWTCGLAVPPAGAHMVLEDMQSETTVPRQYLPSMCR
jgi:uncharacterized RDD family membrane protein YckC/Tfp pilus assembly major pilin PilA